MFLDLYRQMLLSILFPINFIPGSQGINFTDHRGRGIAHSQFKRIYFSITKSQGIRHPIHGEWGIL
jgi:hypothetical protein